MPLAGLLLAVANVIADNAVLTAIVSFAAIVTSVKTIVVNIKRAAK